MGKSQSTADTKRKHPIESVYLIVYGYTRTFKHNLFIDLIPSEIYFMINQYYLLPHGIFKITYNELLQYQTSVFLFELNIKFVNLFSKQPNLSELVVKLPKINIEPTN